MTLLVLNSFIQKKEMETKLEGMGFNKAGNQYRHFTGTNLSIIERQQDLLIQINHSPYLINELIDYFCLRNIVSKIIPKNEKQTIQSFYLHPYCSQPKLKDMILFLLSEQWPLTGKQLHQSIVKLFNRSAPYHTTCKTLFQLHKEEVLTKIDGKYKLNKEWISSLTEFFNQIAQEYKLNEEKYLDCAKNP